MTAENIRIRALHERLIAGLQGIEQVFINGHLTQRVPHNLNISFNYVEVRLIKSTGSVARSISTRPVACAASTWNTTPLARQIAPSAAMS